MYNSAFAQQVSSTKPNYEYCDLVLQKYMSNVPHDSVHQSLPFLVSMTVVAVMMNYFMFTGIVLYIGTASTNSRSPKSDVHRSHIARKYSPWPPIFRHLYLTISALHS